MREGQDRPLFVTVGMSRNFQGSDSSRVIEGHLGWARGGTRGLGAQGSSNSPFPEPGYLLTVSRADLTRQVAESWG